jgi:hypothetical protein
MLTVQNTHSHTIYLPILKPPVITALQITLPCDTNTFPNATGIILHKASLLKPIRGVCNLAKFGVHAGKMKFNAQNKE